MIFCKTSLRIKVNCIFLDKITGLVQNLPTATINPSTTKKLNLRDFALPLAFSFIFIKLLNKSDVSSSRNSSHQNVAIQENLKLIFFNIKDMKGDIKSNIQLLIFPWTKKHSKKLTKHLNRCCRLMDSSTEEVGLILPVFLRRLPDMFDSYTAVFSVVTQPSSSGGRRCVTTPPPRPIPYPFWRVLRRLDNFLHSVLITK